MEPDWPDRGVRAERPIGSERTERPFWSVWPGRAKRRGHELSELQQRRVAGNTTATLASVSLTAGSYTLNGAARYFGTDTISVVGCSFAASGGSSSLHQLPNGSVLDVTSGSESPTFATIPVIGDITVTTGPTTVNLRCNNSNGSDTADIQSGAIVATKIATITAQ